MSILLFIISVLVLIMWGLFGLNFLEDVYINIHTTNLWKALIVFSLVAGPVGFLLFLVIIIKELLDDKSDSIMKWMEKK